MAEKSGDEEVVCEFFGIQITTKNPNVARILQTDMAEFVNQDIKLISRGRSAPSNSDSPPDRHEADNVALGADSDESDALDSDKGDALDLDEEI